MTGQKCFDVAVVGLGTMGTFACLAIARRKASVIGLDLFTPPHDRGSHSGDTRIYREAYAEHSDYAPIAVRAGHLWEELGEQAGRPFLHRSGMLNIGTAGSQLISGIRASATRHELPIEELSSSEVATRFPAFAPPDDTIAIFESRAGWIDVNDSLKFGLSEAARLGAELHFDTAVTSWEPDGSGLRIETSNGPVWADHLVITAGAWAAELLVDLRIPLKVLRKVLVWADPWKSALFEPEVFPIFAYSDRFFYGFPNFGGKGVKIAIHRDPNPIETEACVRQSPPTESEIEPVLCMASQLMPNLAGPYRRARVVDARTCLYTMTPDEHFIVDHHLLCRNVVFGAGFSGHGFKFAPLIGGLLADMALLGNAVLPIQFWRYGGP